MKQIFDLADIRINATNPIGSRRFMAIGLAMNYPLTKCPPSLDWKYLEKECYQHFLDYGYDLQSGIWFCLIRLHSRGVHGLIPALDKLVNTWVSESKICWPPAHEIKMRSTLLEWLKNNVITCLYTYNFKDNTIYEVENICNYFEILYIETKKFRIHDALSYKNICHYIQAQSRSACIAPLKQTIDKSVIPVKKLALSIQESGSPRTRASAWLYATGGMFAGVVFSVALISLKNFITQTTTTQKLVFELAHIRKNELIINELLDKLTVQELQREHGKILKEAEQSLQWISSQPGYKLLLQGNNLAKKLEHTWPGNHVSNEWRKSLKANAQGLASIDSFQRVNDDLDRFDFQLQSIENKKGNYITISELKSISWKIRQDINAAGAPVEHSLNTQADNTTLEKNEIRSTGEKLTALSSLYILKNK
ncbi:hypothetical protein CU788_19770 [Salmonella enterica]|nr:hypothetical protein [Salmonella enterica]